MIFNRQGTEDQQQSSTTSEQLASRKRKRSPSPVSDDDDSENFALLEEDWDLTKIIFIKDVKTVPIGKVTKVSAGVFGGGRNDYSIRLIILETVDLHGNRKISVPCYMLVSVHESVL